MPFRAETGKYGFRDWRKKRRIKPQYDDVFEFQEHVAAVKQNGVWGYIDTNGKMIIPNIYTKVLNFENGIATVEKDNYTFKINKKGNCIEGCSTANSSLE